MDFPTPTDRPRFGKTQTSIVTSGGPRHCLSRAEPCPRCPDLSQPTLKMAALDNPAANECGESIIAPCVEGHSATFEADVCSAIQATLGKVVGHDSEGFEYESIFHLWDVERARTPSSSTAAEAPAWYSNALGYWDACEPTVEGRQGRVMGRCMRSVCVFTRRVYGVRRGPGLKGLSRH